MGKKEYYKCVGYKKRERDFTIGKVYEVIDGEITNDNGYTYNCFNGIEDIIKDFLSDFYEFEKLDYYCDYEIKIYKAGNKVIARNKNGQEGVAKCNTKFDTFDFNVGAKLAFDRLMEKIENKYNGKFVVTESNDIAFTVGKIYKVVDGKFYSDITTNTPLPRKRALHNFNELKEYLEVKDKNKNTYSFDIKTNIKILEIKE